MRMNMNGLWTVIVVLGALLVACVQEAPVAPAAASEPTPEQQEEQKADEGPIAATEAPSQETVSTPAPPDHRAILRSIVSFQGLAGPYTGAIALEATVLKSDVIARVSLVSKRTAVVARLPGQTNGTEFAATLEFRFRVHEYLKGTGPNEIGGLVYLSYWRENDATLGAAQIVNAHDSRWDSREAVVFLTKNKDVLGSTPVTPAYPISSDQYWFGSMAHDFAGSPQGLSEAYTVASVYSKLWLPEAQASPSTRSTASPEQAFLLDAPASTTGGARSNSAITAPTITLADMKSKIAALEAQANVGGTPEYYRCVANSYNLIKTKAYEVSQQGTGILLERTDVSVKSGQPAGTLIWSRAQVPGMLPDQTGYSEFYGPDSNIVRRADADLEPAPQHWPASLGDMSFTMRLVTTRPLPEGAHNFFHWAHYPYLTNCSMPLPTHLQTQFPFYVSVSKPVNAAHEAFFDPVDIGDAVGADATNGVLKPTTFTHDGTPVTISGLKWENGTVTLELSPTASLADYNLDFIDVTGTTTLSLTSDNASTTALTWTVPDAPWADGDLLMLRIREPVSAEPVTVTITPRPQGSLTYFDVAVSWNDPETCDGRYFVYIGTERSLIRNMGFHAPTVSTVTSSTGWLYDSVPDFWAIVRCDPSGGRQSREIGRVSLRAAVE